jgi:hypothetical protein
MYAILVYFWFIQLALIALLMLKKHFCLILTCLQAAFWVNCRVSQKDSWFIPNPDGIPKSIGGYLTTAEHSKLPVNCLNHDLFD